MAKPPDLTAAEALPPGQDGQKSHKRRNNASMSHVSPNNNNKGIAKGNATQPTVSQAIHPRGGNWEGRVSRGLWAARSMAWHRMLSAELAADSSSD